MNERTNVTDKGYSYGGKNYVYETRTDFNGNPYQVAIESKTSVPTLQTTNAQRATDAANGVKYDSIMQAKGYTTPATVTTTDPTKTTTTTVTDPNKGVTVEKTTKKPEDLISQYYSEGYSDPYDIYKKILNSSDATVDYASVAKAVEGLKGDQTLTAKSGYAKQLRQLDEDRTKLQTEFDDMKKNLDVQNAAAIDSITSKFTNLRYNLRQSMENLKGAHEKMGYATGGNRYTQMQSAGLLTNDEQNLIGKLGELASQEQIALLQASQAKSKGDWELLQNTLNAYDKINDNRTTILKNLSDIADKENKRLTEQKKLDEKVALMGFSDPAKLATAIAASVVELSKDLKEDEFDAFVTAKAEENGITTDILKSAMLAQSNKDLLDAAKLKKLQTPTSGKGGKKGTVTERRSEDISTIINDFKSKMQKNNWKGANPDQYEYYKEQIFQQYGNAGVKELEKAMKEFKIIVDRTG